jgi:hypothetical protein
MPAADRCEMVAGALVVIPVEMTAECVGPPSLNQFTKSVATRADPAHR